jgi:hypothetical protein
VSRETSTKIKTLTLIIVFVIAAHARGNTSCLFHKKYKQNLFVPDNKEIVRSMLSNVDSLLLTTKVIHHFSIEARPAYVFHTKPFFKTNNIDRESINFAYSTHLKYSFSFCKNTLNNQIYNGAYQGVGLAHFVLGSNNYFGSPFAFYLFQGARISSISSNLSLNYEWNFGLSCNWKPYDPANNIGNSIIGSKVNAYINVNFYLSWILSKRLSLTSGVSITHFSNGNTKYPNAGLNTSGVKTGITYNFGKNIKENTSEFSPINIPAFPRHISYDLVLFGAWRRTGADCDGVNVASPDAYAVLGFSFASMYNTGYKFRLGIAIDGVYDGSANVYAFQYNANPTMFLKPSTSKQLALGISARAEYIMPYFTVNLGIGDNCLYGKGDLNACYQILALKAEVTRSCFIHIGYSLKNFHEPNSLMLGFGFRFNNKYPVFYRK